MIGWRTAVVLTGTLSVLTSSVVLLIGRNLGPSSEQMSAVQTYLDEREFEKARDLGIELLSFTPNGSTRDQLSLWLGRAWWEDTKQPENRRLAEAVKHWVQIPEDSGLYTEAILARADQKLFHAKRLGEAEAIVQEALDRHPHCPKLRRWMIIWCLVSNQPEQIESHFRAGQRGGSPDAQEALWVTWILSKWAPELVETAFDRRFGVAGETEITSDSIRLERWNTWRILHPSQPSIYAGLASWYLERGETGVAANFLKTGKPHAERELSAAYLATSARWLAKCQRHDQAAQVLGLLENLPESVWTLLTRAQLAVARGDSDTAREIIIDVLSSPESPASNVWAPLIESLENSPMDEQELSLWTRATEQHRSYSAVKAKLVEELTAGSAADDRMVVVEIFRQHGLADDLASLPVNVQQNP